MRQLTVRAPILWTVNICVRQIKSCFCPGPQECPSDAWCRFPLKPPRSQGGCSEAGQEQGNGREGSIQNISIGAPGSKMLHVPIVQRPMCACSGWKGRSYSRNIHASPPWNTALWGKQMVGELSNLPIAKSSSHKTVFTSRYQTTFKQEQKVTFLTLLVNCSHLYKRAIQSPYAHDSSAITRFGF